MAKEEFYNRMIRQHLDMEQAARRIAEPMFKQQIDMQQMMINRVEPILRQVQDSARMMRIALEPAVRQKQELARMMQVATERISSLPINFGRVSREMKEKESGQLQVATTVQDEKEKIPLKVKLIQKKIQIKASLCLNPKHNGENSAVFFGWFIPRKYRNDIIGDILEDCAEMRQIGCSEWRIKFHVVYQWLIAVVSLLPASIIGILWRAKSPPK